MRQDKERSPREKRRRRRNKQGGGSGEVSRRGMSERDEEVREGWEGKMERILGDGKEVEVKHSVGTFTPKGNGMRDLLPKKLKRMCDTERKKK